MSDDAPKTKVGLLGRMLSGKTNLFKSKQEVEAEQKRKEEARLQAIRDANTEDPSMPPIAKKPSIIRTKKHEKPRPKKGVSFAPLDSASPPAPAQIRLIQGPGEEEVDDVEFESDPVDHYDPTTDRFEPADGMRYNDHHNDRYSPNPDREESPVPPSPGFHDHRESPSQSSEEEDAEDDEEEDEDASSAGSGRDRGGSVDDVPHPEESTSSVASEPSRVVTVNPAPFQMPQSLSTVADSVVGSSTTTTTTSAPVKDNSAHVKRSATSAAASYLADQTETKFMHDNALSEQIRDAARSTTLGPNIVFNTAPGSQMISRAPTLSRPKASSGSLSSTSDRSDEDSEDDTFELEIKHSMDVLPTLPTPTVEPSTVTSAPLVVVEAPSYAAQALMSRSTESLVSSPTTSSLGSVPDATPPTKTAVSDSTSQSAPAPEAEVVGPESPSLTSAVGSAAVPALPLADSTGTSSSTTTVSKAKLLSDFAKFEKLRARGPPSTHSTYFSPYALEDTDPGRISQHYDATFRNPVKRTQTDSDGHSIAILTHNLLGRTATISPVIAPKLNVIPEKRASLISPIMSGENSVISDDHSDPGPSDQPTTTTQPVRSVTLRPPAPTVQPGGSPRGSTRSFPSLPAVRTGSFQSATSPSPGPRLSLMQRQPTKIFSNLVSATPKPPSPSSAASTAVTPAPPRHLGPSLASVVHSLIRSQKPQDETSAKPSAFASAVSKVRDQLKEQRRALLKVKAAGPTEDEFQLTKQAIEAAKQDIQLKAQSKKEDEVVIRDLMTEMLDGVVKQVASDRWHEAANKTWKVKKQRVEINKNLTEAKTNFTRMITQMKQQEKARQNAPKRALPALFTILKTKGIAAANALATVGIKKKKPAALTGVVSQAQKAAKAARAAIAARQAQETAEVASVLTGVVEAVVAECETLSPDEQIDRTVEFVLNGVVSKIEQDSADDDMLRFLSSSAKKMAPKVQIRCLLVILYVPD
jgi:hypothetical protein